MRFFFFFFEFSFSTNIYDQHYLSYNLHFFTSFFSFTGMSERDVDEHLDNVIILFRYLHDRDVFSEYYKGQLSKRLLTGRSASDDAEKSMIGKLKAECGYQFTQQVRISI